VVIFTVQILINNPDRSAKLLVHVVLRIRLDAVDVTLSYIIPS
jgi:hypothetical protein